MQRGNVSFSTRQISSASSASVSERLTSVAAQLDLSVLQSSSAIINSRRERFNRQQSASLDDLDEMRTAESLRNAPTFVLTDDVNDDRNTSPGTSGPRRNSVAECVMQTEMPSSDVAAGDWPSGEVTSATGFVEKTGVFRSKSTPLSRHEGKRNVQFTGVSRLVEQRRRFQRSPTPYCSGSQPGSCDSKDETDGL